MLDNANCLMQTMLIVITNMTHVHEVRPVSASSSCHTTNNRLVDLVAVIDGVLGPCMGSIPSERIHGVFPLFGGRR